MFHSRFVGRKVQDRSRKIGDIVSGIVPCSAFDTESVPNTAVAYPVVGHFSPTRKAL